MGKLNYSARKINGIKAGQVLSKDLTKRIPPGNGSKAAARDPTLEIDIAGKSLTDEGFAQFIDNLIDCIRYKDEEHHAGLAKITELHLQNNGLTVQSLGKLREVIISSAGDLRELDLSHNNIKVVEPEEKKTWKKFLESFNNCYLLKKLNFGNNPLGAAGIEILACVYVKSDLDYLETDADNIIGSNPDGEAAAITEDTNALKIAEEKEKENESPRTSRTNNKKSPGKGKATRQSYHSQSSSAAANKTITTADLKVYACTRGLRSIPFLIISNVEMADVSAVHLSSMLSVQREPDQLLAFLPPGKSPATSDMVEGCKSIIWQPNESLAPHSKKLLELTQTVQEARAEHISDDSEGLDDEEGTTQRQLQSKLELEYARLTKRIRLGFLKKEGAQCSEIASTAIRMKAVARALLLDDKDREDGPPSDDEIAVVEDPYIPQPTTGETEVYHNDDSDDFVGYSEHIEFVPPYLVGPFHPNAEMFDEEFPALQMAIHREEIVDVGDSPSPRSSTNTGPRSGKGIPRHANASREIRKEEWRFGLPYDLWRRIIADAVGADGILDHEQQARIIQYASDWNAVAYGLTIKGVERHQQIWKFLETVGCFTYTALA